MPVVNQKGIPPACAGGVIPSTVHKVIQEHLQTGIRHKESFFVGDEPFIHNQLKLWESKLSDVEPFYAVKCNDNLRFLRILAEHGLGFDCASQSEMQRILNLGVEPHRILYAAPFKSEDGILYAKEHGVTQTMFDTEDELRKLADYFPNAELYLRLWADDPSSRVRLGSKYGVQLPQAKELLVLAQELNMKVIGLCFHVGSSAADFDAYRQAIAFTREVYDFNQSLREDQRHPIRTIDIGGGFSLGNFESAATAIRTSIRQYFGDEKHLRWFAEPGRYFAEEAFYLVCRVLGTRPRACLGNGIGADEKLPVGDIHINDGIYHNFLNALTEQVVPQPILLDCTGTPYVSAADNGDPYTVWGQTCDSFDKIATNCVLPRRAKVGDWLCFPFMGAYTHVTGSDFNGFPKLKKTIWISNSPEDVSIAASSPLRTLRALQHYLVRAVGLAESTSSEREGIGFKVNDELAAFNSSVGLVDRLLAGLRALHILSGSRH
ncbi:ornithine decarboxylase [Coccidioides immitis RS]|uniref:ornithine decarboxylase n=4 Tax=Coccidioides immitis TaxID=5501 RepID=A0A0E1S0H1_COCIM|nr:ornithine decarboxylase [Coccidioides immitis RS]EAS28362.2 ornithine decarboxylase [Coccidioides immitis RS]KMP09213.1 ornithine decarboxylase [Coccidioides immitis RMSCC 2394]KMU86016.1 ornithine decarboxylase [Coccidioides immitis H538.4]TPX20994.1 hypothetical protein DIZ76_016891 [Coccidioides immitis]